MSSNTIHQRTPTASNKTENHTANNNGIPFKTKCRPALPSKVSYFKAIAADPATQMVVPNKDIDSLKLGMPPLI